MTIFDAVVVAVQSSMRANAPCYLYQYKRRYYGDDVEYFILAGFYKDWLFRASPGGRGELSALGRDRMIEEIGGLE